MSETSVNHRANWRHNYSPQGHPDHSSTHTPLASQQAVKQFSPRVEEGDQLCKIDPTVTPTVILRFSTNTKRRGRIRCGFWITQTDNVYPVYARINLQLKMGWVKRRVVFPSHFNSTGHRKVLGKSVHTAIKRSVFLVYINKRCDLFMSVCYYKASVFSATNEQGKTLNGSLIFTKNKSMINYTHSRYALNM